MAACTSGTCTYSSPVAQDSCFDGTNAGLAKGIDTFEYYVTGYGVNYVGMYYPCPDLGTQGGYCSNGACTFCPTNQNFNPATGTCSQVVCTPGAFKCNMTSSPYAITYLQCQIFVNGYNVMTQWNPYGAGCLDSCGNHSTVTCSGTGTSPTCGLSISSGYKWNSIQSKCDTSETDQGSTYCGNVGVNYSNCINMGLDSASLKPGGEIKDIDYATLVKRTQAGRYHVICNGNTCSCDGYAC